MPTRNRSNGRKNAANKDKQSAQSKVRDVASQAASKVGNVRDEVAGYYSQGTERFGQMTRGHEGQAMLIALAAGFGVGLVIGCSLASASQRPQSWHERITAEGVGRKLMDRVEQMLPHAVAEYLGK